MDNSQHALLSAEKPRRSGIQHQFHPPRLACSSRMAQRFARWLVMLLILLIAGMLFAPWQQNFTGSGRVVAFSPLVREQTLEVTVSGRITKFAENISEGMHIKKGDFIAEIRDLDPELLARLEDQLLAKRRELEATMEIVKAYTGQVSAFETVRDETVLAADEYVKMAGQKKLAEQQEPGCSHGGAVSGTTELRTPAEAGGRRTLVNTDATDSGAETQRSGGQTGTGQKLCVRRRQ